MDSTFRVLTRRELFNLVWSTPVQKLAAEFGVSDRGLTKICVRHRVPSPSRGYWARVAAGQKFPIPPLPAVGDPSLDRIVVHATASHLPVATQAAIVASKAARVARARERSTDEPPRRADFTVARSHRAIAPTARVLRKAKPDPDGAVTASGEGLCGIKVHSDRIERAIAYLDALAHALEREGLELLPQNTCMKIEVGPDSVRFSLSERHRRQPHVPTPAEHELFEKQQARRRRAQERGDWGLYTSLPYEKPWREHDFVYDGQLAFEIEGYSNGLRKKWADGKTQTLESMFDDILAGLQVALTHQEAERERREEHQRRSAELSRRRELQRQRHQREQKRIEYLRRIVDLQREAADVRSWLASLPPASASETTSDLGRMIAWARARLAELEAETTINAATAKLDGRALFPEVDELHDPKGDPPSGYY